MQNCRKEEGRNVEMCTPSDTFLRPYDTFQRPFDTFPRLSDNFPSHLTPDTDTGQPCRLAERAKFRRTNLGNKRDFKKAPPPPMASQICSFCKSSKIIQDKPRSSKINEEQSRSTKINQSQIKKINN